MTTPLLDRYAAIFGPDGFLNQYNVERREEIELLGLASVSGVDTLFLGEPGVGKTWAIELLVDAALVDMRLFTHLFAKDQSPAEVLGPLDIMAMKNGQIARLIDGFAPSSNYFYADEVFKASPPMLNPMLDLLANRRLKVGGHSLDCSQLVTIFMSSNELPDREDLMAFRDRIGITKYVLPVRTPEGMRSVTDIQLDYQGAADTVDTTGLEPLTLDDISAIRGEVRQIEVPAPIRETMTELQQEWAEAGHGPSQRRVGQMWKVIKARAWAHGRPEVVTDDLLPAQHMAWNHPDHADSARSLVLEKASKFTRKAARAREAMEPIVAEIEALKAQLVSSDPADREDLLTKGFRLMTRLRTTGADVRDQIKDGEKQGQSTELLGDVLDDLSRSYVWAARELASGGEDDPEDYEPRDWLAQHAYKRGLVKPVAEEDED